MPPTLPFDSLLRLLLLKDFNVILVALIVKMDSLGLRLNYIMVLLWSSLRWRIVLRRRSVIRIRLLLIWNWRCNIIERCNAHGRKGTFQGADPTMRSGLIADPKTMWLGSWENVVYIGFTRYFVWLEVVLDFLAGEVILDVFVTVIYNIKLCL